MNGAIQVDAEEMRLNVRRLERAWNDGQQHVGIAVALKSLRRLLAATESVVEAVSSDAEPTS